MSGPRTATLHQADLLWPVVEAARLFPSRAAYEQFVHDGRWRIRIAANGAAAVLDRWREHMRILAIRAAWAPLRELRVFVDDAKTVAAQSGLEQVLSPLVSEELLAAYERAGMQPLEQIVAFRGLPKGVVESEFPQGLTVRRAHAEDVDAIVAVDTHSFFPFWRYGTAEVAEAMRDGRVMVALRDSDVVAYSMLTASRGIVMLARVAVLPSARGQGIGLALVSDAARYAERAKASEITLCTQTSNAEARALYSRAGLTEVSEAYFLAVTDAVTSR